MTFRQFCLSIALIILVTVGIAYFNRAPNQLSSTAPNPQPPRIQCDQSLWAHVYPGDPRKFKQPQDRLTVINDCVSVTGVIDSAVAEADGDWHLRLKLDPPYTSMLNAKNMSGQSGHLVLEPVCANPVTQKDTIQEKSCVGFSQKVFMPSMLHKRVQVIGAFVLDQEHGWQELHPVTSITPI